MAGKRLGIFGAVSGFGRGFVQGYQIRKKIEGDDADRELRKKQFEKSVYEAEQGSIVLDPSTNQVYRTSGITPQQRARLLGLPEPATETNPPSLGSGNLKVLPPAKKEEPVTNVTVDEFNKDPDSYRSKKIKIVPSPKGSGLSSQQRFALDTARQLMKEYITNGQLNANQANLLSDVSKTLDVSVVPEEDQGLLAFIQNFGGKSYHPAVDKTKPAPKAGQKQEAKLIRVRHKGTNQTGTIPEAEFDAALYERI